MNRRTFLKQSLGGFIALLTLSGGGYVYAKELEPRRINIQYETIQASHISPVFNDFKIVQFSDTHLGFHYSLEQFSELIRLINEQEPDLIVFTGDLIDKPNDYKQLSSLEKQLKLLEAPYGKFWIFGNHDHGGYGTDILKTIMKNSNFTLLQNKHTIIQKETERIILVGVDDLMLGNPDLDQALNGADPELFTILLVHEPDFAKIAVNHTIDIQLSGHSHGGQVRLPFIGHLYTPLYAEKYVRGKYNIKDNFTLYVNSGIGTTRLPFRFLCTPEIHVYTLQSKM